MADEGGLEPNGAAEEEAREIGEFQRFLDERFPIGALCAGFVSDDDRLTATGLELITGRLICTGAARNGSGVWKHRILIDTRGGASDDAVEFEAWVTSIGPQGERPGLWEAVLPPEESNGDLLRLLSDPKPPWRPTEEMRHAVSKAHGIPD